MPRPLACLIVAIPLVAGCGPRDESSSQRQSLPLASLLGDERPGFAQAAGQREFRFPQDHAAHPDFRNEWWYVTGNLDGSQGQRFGYELTLFRFALAPENAADNDSAWSTRQVYVGHFALTDVAGQSFYVAERAARAAIGLAGAEAEPLRIWLYDWSLRRRAPAGQETAWQLQAADGERRIELRLTPQKSPLLQGDNGLSRKSSGAANASWYYSIPRLQTTGVIEIDDQRHEVSGLSWIDREWSSSALGSDQQGWDWFALQLDDGSDLMFYQLRSTSGERHPQSAGRWSRADGSSVALAANEVTIDVLGHWDSPAGGRYPQGWRLQVPSLLVDLRIRPVLPDQELETWVRYWEGAVDVSGTRGANRIGGRGYVELTGYANAAAKTPP